MSGEQFGKDTMWHNIITCSSVDFASKPSMLIWSYFCRHGDNCPNFSECINVDCSDVDVFWVLEVGEGMLIGVMLLLGGHFGPL